MSFSPLSMNNNFYFSKKNIDNKKSYTQRNNFALQWYGTLRKGFKIYSTAFRAKFKNIFHLLEKFSKA